MTKLPGSALLWTAGGLAFALLILIGAAWLSFRENITRWMLNPRIPYQVYEPPPAPDYANPGAWAAFGTGPGASSEAGFDLFFLAPTVYASAEEWNAPLADPDFRAAFETIALDELARPLAQGARLFVPYWRQGTLYTLWSHAEDSRRARGLAYRDVARALSFYLDHSPPGRPLVLLGLGQGGQHLVRLLTDGYDPRLQSRLAVAYVLGQPVPLPLAEGPLAVPLCAGETDTGCLAAWTTIASEEDPGPLTDRSMTWHGNDLEATRGKRFACLNPLLWTSEEASAPQSMNLGARPIGPAFPGGNTQEMHFGAQCADGLLVVDAPAGNALGLGRWSGTDLRLIDLAPFHENLRANITARVAAFQAMGQPL